MAYWMAYLLAGFFSPGGANGAEEIYEEIGSAIQQSGSRTIIANVFGSEGLIATVSDDGQVLTWDDGDAWFRVEDQHLLQPMPSSTEADDRLAHGERGGLGSSSSANDQEDLALFATPSLSRQLEPEPEPEASRERLESQAPVTADRAAALRANQTLEEI